MKPFLKQRIIIIGTLLFVLISLGSVHAEQAAQCSIDHPTNSNQSFQQCPAGDANDAFLNAGFTGVRVDPSNEPSKTPIWAHDVCRYVDNSNSSDPIFIPIRSPEEWAAFLANPPSRVHVAGCCLPRTLTVGDLPVPQTDCPTAWQLKGIVDGSQKKLIATPISSMPDAGFKLAPEVQEDAKYPVENLPISRDDISATLPDRDRTEKGYTAFYSCGEKLDAYINFRMHCTDAKWISDGKAASPTPPTAKSDKTTAEVMTAKTNTEVTPTADCQTSAIRTYSKPCADGSAGSTTYQQVFNSCTKQIDTQVLKTTCGGITGGTTGCIASSNTSTTQCPANQSGLIVTKTEHICDGSNNGDGSDKVTVISNTCSTTGGGTVSSCTPLDTLTTTPCPDPTAGGIITLRRIRVCDGSNNGAGTTTETVVANNCQPSGCIDSIILKSTSICQGGTTVTAKVYNSCTKLISTKVISSTCN